MKGLGFAVSHVSECLPHNGSIRANALLTCHGKAYRTAVSTVAWRRALLSIILVFAPVLALRKSGINAQASFGALPPAASEYRTIVPAALVASAASNAPPVGLNLCREMEKILSTAITQSNKSESDDKPLQRKAIKAKIEHQNLSPTTNTLPYNLILTMGDGAALTRMGRIVVIAFRMEDAYKNADMVTQLVKDVIAVEDPCVLLFSYGDIEPYKAARTLSGTAAFAGELSDASSCVAVCVSWGTGDEVEVINGGRGQTTSAGMLMAVCTSLTECSIEYNVLAGSFGTLYRFGVLQQDENVSAFIGAGANACGVQFYEGIDSIKAARALQLFVHQGTDKENTRFDTGGVHYILWHTQNHLFVVTERFIVLIFIAASFLFTLFVCLPSKKRKIEAVRQVLRVLHLLPITLIITSLSFMAGQKAAGMLHIRRGITLSAQFCVKLSVAFFVITVVYCLLVYFLRPLGKTYTKGLEQAISEEVYCYLLSVVSLLNMLIFSAIDISTVFVFALEYIIVLIARKCRTVLSLLISCVLMAVPFVPYVSVLSRYAETSTLTSMVYASMAHNALYSMLFVPHLMQWLRILSRIFAARSETLLSPAQIAASKMHTARAALMTAALTLGFGATMFAASKAARIGRRHSTQDEVIEMDEIKDGLLVCTVRDDQFFGDTLRTVSIDTGKQCMEVVAEIKGENAPVVVYCDDFYMTNDEIHTDTFRLPPYPPQNVTFSFSADDSQSSVVTVTAVYGKSYGEASGETAAYELRKAVVEVEAAK